MAADIAKGSGVPNKEKVGTVTRAQVEEICKKEDAKISTLSDLGSTLEG